MPVPIDIKYDSSLKELVYKSDEETLVIPEDRVIGVVKEEDNETSLLYVHILDKPEEKAEDITFFKSLSLGKNPSGLEHFTPPGGRGGASSPFLEEVKTPERLSVVISTASGGHHAERFFQNALQPLLARLGLHKDSYNIHTTSSASSIASLVKSTLLPRANSGISQAIILLSGDGGIVDIVNGVTASPPTPAYAKPHIILIPMGTGNALAHSSNITADATHGLSTLFRGTPRPLPLFKIHFSDVEAIDQKPDRKHGYDMHGAVVCSWGLHAALVADSDTPEYRKHGVERFKMAAKENLFPSDRSAPHHYRGRVSMVRSGGGHSIEWEAIPRDEHSYVLATMVSQLEAGFTISPKSKPLDGRIRLVHFGPLDGDGNEVMRIMGLAYQGGKHVGENGIGYEDVDAVKIEFDEDEARFRRVCVDGKIVTVAKGGSLELWRERLDVLDLFAM